MRLDVPIKIWKWSSQKTQAAQEKHKPCLQPDSRALYEIHLYEILKFKWLNCWAVWIFDVTGRCCRNRSSSYVADATLQTLTSLFTSWIIYARIRTRYIKWLAPFTWKLSESPIDVPGNWIGNNWQTSLSISPSLCEFTVLVVLFLYFVKFILHRFIYLFSHLVEEVHIQNGNEIIWKVFCIFSYIQGVYM